jgi:hypothetical protein
MFECFVVGNGKSRLQVDLKEIQKIGPVYGCNHLYLEFTPDVLVAYDEKITFEIEKTGYSKKNIFYSNYPDTKTGSLHFEGFNYSNSGACAAFLAASHGFKNVYMLGIDIINSDEMTETIYNPVPIKHELWFWSYFGLIFDKFNTTKFIRVSDFNNEPVDWKFFKNYNKMTLREFLLKYNCEKK